MSYFKVIPQKKGDGAGRVRYLLLNSDGEPVKVYSNIVEDLFLNANENLQDENYKRKLANRFNQILKYRQNEYKTKHLVVSFSHLLSDEEIEKAVNIIETQLAFKIADTSYMIVIHKEPNERTAFHIVVSRNSQGKIIDFNKKEFYLTKKELAEQFKNAGLMNELEIKAYNNLKENKATKENKVKGQDIKNKIKDIATKIMEHLENGRIKNAKALANYYDFKVEWYKAGERSPVKDEILKRNRLYVSAVIKDKKEKKYKRIYIRADKHLKAFFSKYTDIQNKLIELEELKKPRKAEQKAEIKNIPDLSIPSIPKMPIPKPALKKIKVEKPQQEQKRERRNKHIFISKAIQENFEKILKKIRERENKAIEMKIRRLNNIHISKKIVEGQKIEVNKPNMFEIQDINIKGAEDVRAREERRVFGAYRKLQETISRIRTADRGSREVERKKISIETIERTAIPKPKNIDTFISRTDEFSRNTIQADKESLERYRRNIEQFERLIHQQGRKEKKSKVVHIDIFGTGTTEPKKEQKPSRNPDGSITLNIWNNNDNDSGIGFDR